MNVNLTGEQLLCVKQMTSLVESVGTQIYHIMENHGLNDVEGCRLVLTVDPAKDLSTVDISIGYTDSPFGKVTICRGKKCDKFTPYGKNSTEYELLFADAAIKEKMMKILSYNKQKELPADGLWVGKEYGEE